MGTYGAEFINVADHASDPSGWVTLSAGGGTIDPSWFAAIQGERLPSGAIGGMILYLPPGRWRVSRARNPRDSKLPLRWSPDEFRVARDTGNIPSLLKFESISQENPWNADVVLDARVTLQFAPGAVLVLEDDVRVAARGDLDAEDYQIIEEHGRSMFIPASNALTPLRAVWWGVGIGRDSADALERVIEAATNRRRPWRRVFVGTDSQGERVILNGLVVSMNRVLPSLPVLLRGEIPITHTVRVGNRDPFGLEALVFERTNPALRIIPQVQSAVLLRGVANGRTRPSASIRALRSFDDGRAGVGAAMLSLEFTRASQIEGIAFDGAGVASRCVEFVAQFPDRDMHHVQVRRCAFTGATRALVQIGPPPEGPLDTETVTLVDTHGFVGDPARSIAVVVPAAAAGSYPRTFGSDEGTLAAFPSTDFSGLVVESCNFDVRGGERADVDALVIRASQAVPASVSDCRFQGDANAFVAAVAGTVLVESCQFQNERVPAPRTPVSPMATSFEGLGTERADGADVELSVDVLDRELWNRLGSNGQPLRRGDTPIGAVMLLGCTSASARLLATPRPSPFTLQRPLRSSLVIGCVQHRRTAPGTAVERASSIQWGIPRGVRRVGLLSLLNTAPQAYTPADSMLRSATAPAGARPSSDISLCVIGCRIDGPVEVYSGATDTSLVGVHATDAPSRPFRFSQVARGILRPTVILGLCLALVLLGCTSSNPPTDARAQDISQVDLPETASADRVDGADSDEGGLDAAMDAGASDTGVVDVRREEPDSGVIRFASLGPPRQMRHNCPAVTDGDPAIPAPRLIYPMSGTRATSRRPGFRWELAPGTTGVRVEVCADPCCARVITAYDADGTTLRPAEMLPPGVVWWRARGRTAMGYGRATSFTWEVGIKRRDAPIDTAWGTLRDVNGDGYDDIATTADVMDVSRLYTIMGSPSGPRYNVTDYISHPDLGRHGDLSYGDFNADGRADLMFGTSIYGSVDRGNLLLLYGADRGLGVQRSQLFEPVQGAMSSADVNGDGFQDFVTSQHTYDGPVGRLRDRSRLIVYGGSWLGDGGVSHVADASIGGNVTSYGYNTVTRTVGDLDGDGYADVMVSDRRVGRVMIFRGLASGVESVPRSVIDNSLEQDGAGFGTVIYPVGDIDGDQLADFTIWLMSRDQIAVYRGDRTAMAAFVGAIRVPEEDLSVRSGRTAFGSRSGSGPDLNGDGRAEVAVGCEECFWVNDNYPQGGAYVYSRMESGEMSLLRRMTLPNIGNLGASAVGIGDIDGDGFDDLGVATDYIGNRLLLFFGRGDDIREMRSITVAGPAERTERDEISFGRRLAMMRRFRTQEWM